MNKLHAGIIFFILLLSIVGLVVEIKYVTIQHTPDQTPPLNVSATYAKKYPMIAFVKPVFTTSAYANAFYLYYQNTSLDPKKYLITTVKYTWDDQRDTQIIAGILSAGYPSNRTTVITDIDIHNNDLYYANGSLKYAVLVFFHSEYVTIQEYEDTYTFIARGGNVLLLDGNAFYAIVAYHATSNTIMLVHGHGYTFNGSTVTTIPARNFYLDKSFINTTNWIGSTYSYYNFDNAINASIVTTTTNPNPISVELVRNNITGLANARVYRPLYGYYYTGEADALTSSNADIIANWNLNSSTYTNNIKIYQTFPAGGNAGSLIHYGVYGNGILPYDKASQTFFLIAVRQLVGYYLDDWIRFPTAHGIYNSSNERIVLDYIGTTTNVSLVVNGKEVGQVSPKTDITKLLTPGNNTIMLIFHYQTYTSSREVSVTITT